MEKKELLKEEKRKVFPYFLLLVICLLAIMLFVFTRITDEIVLDKNTQFDVSIYQLVDKTESPVLTRIMILLTFFGSRGFLLPAYILIVGWFWFYKKRFKPGLSIAIIAISSTIVLHALKDVFKRTRPINPLIDGVTSFSYPSGHSFSAFTFCSILMYLIWHTQINKVLKIVCSACLIVLACLVAISRVYLHVHYASDIIAGFCLSIIWLSACYFILRRIKWF